MQTRQEETQDSLLELRIKLERWVKRNRLWLIGAAGAVLLWLGALGVWSLVENQRIEKANGALNALMQNPADATARATLQVKSPELYDLFLLRQAVVTADRAVLGELALKPGVIGHLAAYQLAALSHDPVELARYAQREGNLLKEFAQLQEALLLHEKGDHASARAGLSRIAIDSQLKPVATALEHYGIAR
ncbi:MAG: hypothetical protein AB7E49_03480 [Campylobacterales bacterium]